jgi:hypothetical protein
MLIAFRPRNKNGAGSEARTVKQRHKTNSERHALIERAPVWRQRGEQARLSAMAAVNGGGDGLGNGCDAAARHCVPDADVAAWLALPRRLALLGRSQLRPG